MTSGFEGNNAKNLTGRGIIGCYGKRRGLFPFMRDPSICELLRGAAKQADDGALEKFTHGDDEMFYPNDAYSQQSATCIKPCDAASDGCKARAEVSIRLSRPYMEKVYNSVTGMWEDTLVFKFDSDTETTVKVTGRDFCLFKE